MILRLSNRKLTWGHSMNLLKPLSILLAASGAFLLAACQVSPSAKGEADAPDPAAVEAEIWAKEEAIFEGRGRGDLTNYLSVTSAGYLGWPPVMEKPLGLEKFRESADDAGALEGEKISIVREGFSTEGHTAVAYFTTHRTQLGKGFAPEGERDVDEYYENIHVWTLEGGEWRLIGGMARKLPPAEGRIAPE
jgi:hypothetical protein